MRDQPTRPPAPKTPPVEYRFVTGWHFTDEVTTSAVFEKLDTFGFYSLSLINEILYLLGALMSSWAEVDLTTVTTDNSVLPENQDFEFELHPGARFSKYDPDRVEAAAKVVKGEFAGRIKYFSYPDPNKVGDWVRGVFIRMTHALGSEIEPGESPVEYLNRMAGAHFVTKMKHRIIEVDGVSTTKDDIKIGNVKAVRTPD